MDRLGRVAALAMGSPGACRRVVIYKGETKRDWPSPECDFLNVEDAIGAWQVERGRNERFVLETGPLSVDNLELEGSKLLQVDIS
jgi:hypothetical protein